MKAEQLAKALRDNFSPGQCEEFIRDCAKGLAAELRRRTVEKTPIGNYSGVSYVCESGLSHKGGGGKHGGRLRKSWNVGRVGKNGNKFTVMLENSAPYGSYVEFGHRLRNGGSAAGHKMLTVSADEVRAAVQDHLVRKLNSKMKLGGGFR